MIGQLLVALLLAALPAPQAAAQQEAGTVWIAGEAASLPTSERTSLLLVAAAAESPVPVDARRWGGGAGSVVLDVRAESRPLDVATLERVRRAQRVLLGPGSLAQWRAALWDGKRPTALERALREAWSAGAEVVARTPGGAVLGFEYLDTDPEAVARNPRGQHDSVLRRGLGFVAATIESEARGGDLQPLARRLVRQSPLIDLWIPAAGGVRYDQAESELTGFGDQPVLCFDARGARRAGTRIEGLKIGWLPADHAWKIIDVGQARNRSREALAAAQAVPALWSVAHWLGGAPEPGAQRAWTSGAGTVRLLGQPARPGGANWAILEIELQR